MCVSYLIFVIYTFYIVYSFALLQINLERKFYKSDEGKFDELNYDLRDWRMDNFHKSTRVHFFGLIGLFMENLLEAIRIKFPGESVRKSFLWLLTKPCFTNI